VPDETVTGKLHHLFLRRFNSFRSKILMRGSPIFARGAAEK
jgi:hypothetical protein